MSSVTESVRTNFAAGRVAPLARTAAYCASFVAFGLTAASLGPALPGLIARMQARPNALGLLLSAHSVGFLLGSLGGARLFDRLNGHAVMAVSLLLMSAGLAFAPIASTFWLLAAVLVLLGMAECTLDAGANILLVWTHGERTGPYMNGLHFFYGVGAFLAPLVVAQVARFDYGTGAAFWALALLVLPTVVPFLRLNAPRGPHAEARHEEDATRLEDANTTQLGDARATRLDDARATRLEDASATQTEDACATQRSHDRTLVFLLVAFLFLYLGAEAGFSGWIYSYAVALHLSDAAGAAYLTSLFWGALTVGRLLAVPLAARFTPRALLAADIAGCLSGAAFIAASGDSFASVAAGTIVLGLSMASIFPMTFSLAGRALRLDGRTTSWLLVGASGGGILLPWLMDRVSESAGARSLMLVVAADIFAAAVVFVPLARRTRTDTRAVVHS
jgi:MFS transporter, FHS family, Na+ dependent glucose transporter 1